MGKRTRANGEGTIFKLNGKYRAEKTIGWDGARRIVKTKSGFKLKREAQAWLDAFKTDATQNATITFKALYGLWSVPHYAKVSSDTSNGYKAAYRHCEPLWYRPFSMIKAADLQAVVDACKLSRRTKSDIKFLLAMLYKYAAQNDYCDKDYSKFIKLPKKEESKRDAFNTDEIDKLWKDYNSDTRNVFTGYILIMIYTGMRYGEISRVTKDMINLDERTISGAGIKTDAGRSRVIPIADCIFSIIETLYNKTDKKILTAHEKIFYNDFRCTLERLGIRPLTPHCCRHTFATLAAKTESNIPTATIIDMIGHEKYKTTMDYTHITMDEKIKAVNSLYVPSSNGQ